MLSLKCQFNIDQFEDARTKNEFLEILVYLTLSRGILMIRDKRLFIVESLIGIYPENERFLIFNIFNRFVSSSMTYLFTNRVR